ncbi:MAG: toprim domain-containing protein [Thermoguttaceae bacterium]|nr:toprim domain-containing protein [Thermoguttaceae bacterium]
MSGSFDQREKIRDAIDIVDLVSRYVTLKRQGRIYVGSCPWHDDRRPSLQVNPERQSFKCWVCDIGGDIFSFIMQMEGVDFKESMEILADIAGISLDHPKEFARKSGQSFLTPDKNRKTSSGSVQNNVSHQKGGTEQYIPVEIDKSVLYRALDWLAEQYHRYFLTQPEAETARQYIRERGISDEMIRRFKIGFSPVTPCYLPDLVGGDRNRIHILEAAGVLIHKDHGVRQTSKILSEQERRDYYDRFWGRVVFPIRDTQNRTVAFGGRILPNSSNQSPAKYLNSPETPVFTKSKMLYGLDLARSEIRKSHRVIITEGYTDCIVAHQFGFEDTVAVLGTALGAEHIHILKRFTDKMYLVLDGDEAGQKRTREVLEFFVAQGVDLSILTLPDNKDPCEFLLANGADALEQSLKENAVDALDFALQQVVQGIDLEKDVVGSARAIDQLLGMIALTPVHSVLPNDPIRLRMTKMIQRIAARFRISEEEVRRSLQEHRQKQNLQQSSRVRETGRNVPQDKPSNNVRLQFVYPLPGMDNESNAWLQEHFAAFSNDMWQHRGLYPSGLEKEYLELWFADPALYSTLVKAVPTQMFRSPVTRQLDLLGRDMLSHREQPSWNNIMLRYEDSNMKKLLIELDESATEKKLSERLQNEAERNELVQEIVQGFKRLQMEQEQSRQMDSLRNEDQNQQEKTQKLSELRELLLRKQKNRFGNTGFTEEDRPND